MRYLSGESHQFPGARKELANYQAQHFLYKAEGKLATITLNRPDRKNPLTFDSYAELTNPKLNSMRSDEKVFIRYPLLN